MAVVTGFMRDAVLKRIGMADDPNIIVETNEEIRDDGYCETCSWPYHVLIVTVNNETVFKVADYDDPILELSRWLNGDDA